MAWVLFHIPQIIRRWNKFGNRSKSCDWM